MGRYFCEVKGHATGLFDCLFCKYSDEECKEMHKGKPDAFE